MSAFDRLFAMKDISSLKSPRPVFAQTSETALANVGLSGDKPIKPTSTYVSASLFSPVPRFHQPSDPPAPSIIKPVPFKGGHDSVSGSVNPFLVTPPIANQPPALPTDSTLLTGSSLNPKPRPSLSATFVQNMQTVLQAPHKSSDLSVSFESFIQKDLDGDLPPPALSSPPKPIPNIPNATSNNVSTTANTITSVNTTNSSVNTTNNSVVLCDWRIQRVPNDPEITGHSTTDYPLWIIVEGMKKAPDNIERNIQSQASGQQLWHSSLIVDRVDERTLLTSSGKRYRIEGPMDRAAWIRADIPESIIRAFESGFPSDWRQVLCPWLQIERVKRSISKEKKPTSDAPKKAKRNSEPIRTQKRNTSKTKKTPSPSAPKAPIKTPKTVPTEALETPEPTSAPRSSVSSLPTSRSGRRIVPPLAFWANEYAKRSRDGQLYIIKATRAASLRLNE